MFFFFNLPHFPFIPKRKLIKNNVQGLQKQPQTQYSTLLRKAVGNLTRVWNLTHWGRVCIYSFYTFKYLVFLKYA